MQGVSRLIFRQSLLTCFTGLATPVIQSQRHLGWGGGEAGQQKWEYRLKWPGSLLPLAQLRHKSQQRLQLDTQRDSALLLKHSHLQFSSAQSWLPTPLQTKCIKTGRPCLSALAAASGGPPEAQEEAAASPSRDPLVLAALVLVMGLVAASVPALAWPALAMAFLLAKQEALSSLQPSHPSRSTRACWPLWTWRSTPSSTVSAPRRRSRSRPSTTASPPSLTRLVPVAIYN